MHQASTASNSSLNTL